MKAQPILVVSALFLLGCGIASLFAPQEIGLFLSGHGEPTSSLVVQLLGAGLFALGFLNWFTRFSNVGGVYGRPVLIANCSYFFTAGATLVRHAMALRGAGVSWLLAGISGAFALWFGRLLFFPPKLAVK